MSEPSREQPETADHHEPAVEPADYGTLSVEDDPEGTQDPADLAGSATPDDAPVGYRPSASEADDL